MCWEFEDEYNSPSSENTFLLYKMISHMLNRFKMIKITTFYVSIFRISCQYSCSFCLKDVITMRMSGFGNALKRVLSLMNLPNLHRKHPGFIGVRFQSPLNPFVGWLDLKTKFERLRPQLPAIPRFCAVSVLVEQGVWEEMSPQHVHTSVVCLVNPYKSRLSCRGSVVHVLGEVFNPTSLLYEKTATVGYYLRRVGGLTKEADKKQLSVIRADGSVISVAQKRTGIISWDSDNHRWLFGGFMGIRLNPGDAIVVPRKMDRFFWLKTTRDITQVLFQIAVAAGIVLAL